MKSIRIEDVRNGDTISVTWKPYKATVARIEKYKGLLKGEFPAGASIIRFVDDVTMTYPGDQWVMLHARHHEVIEYNKNGHHNVEAYFKAISAARAAGTYTKEMSMEYLVRLGTHNPDGTLHKDYGGE